MAVLDQRGLEAARAQTLALVEGVSDADLEVFFGPSHHVLRGGSFATSALVATPAFRNWDFPYRRQIFAGLRVAASR